MFSDGWFQNIEINLAIICASVPALKPLVSKIFPKLLGLTGRSGNRSGAGYAQHQDSHTLQSFKRHANAPAHASAVTSSAIRGNKGIYVEHTFEVREDSDGKNINSREGSERNLVPSDSEPYAKSREIV